MYICSVPLARGDAEQLELARLGPAQLALAPRAADLLGARAQVRVRVRNRNRVRVRVRVSVRVRVRVRVRVPLSPGR